jgi:hypothetical protein
MNALGWRLVPCSYEDVMERSDELIRDIKRDLDGYIQKPPPRVEVYE